MFKDRFQFSRERLEFIYSIAVLVLIPILMIANTLMLSVSVRRNFDSELRRKADLANAVVASTITNNLDNKDALQAQIGSIQKSNDELSEITIASPTANGGYDILASSRDDLKGKSVDSSVLYSLTITRHQSIGQLVTAQDGSRSWQVVSPLVVNNTTKAIVATSVSLQRADDLINNTLLQSLGIVGVTVVIIVLLLFNHFRFVEYALLFRKQKEVDQLKNDFLSVATHELRAPMTVIKGSIENLIDGITGTIDERGKKSLQVIFAETDRLNALVNDLLNVSRIEQGRITYEIITVDACTIITDIVNQFTSKAQSKGLALSYQPPTGPVLINVDKGRLIEIMTNLVDNAIKYSKQGSVVVTHKPDQKKARISIRDTGIGMNAKARERLFSRFYRIQTDETRDIPGTGLGLWIIKQYIEQMGGTISVDSLEGVGSEFIIEFPLAQGVTNSHES